MCRKSLFVFLATKKKPRSKGKRLMDEKPYKIEKVWKSIEELTEWHKYLKEQKKAKKKGKKK